jgi:hypothetical protein
MQLKHEAMIGRHPAAERFDQLVARRFDPSIRQLRKPYRISLAGDAKIGSNTPSFIQGGSAEGRRGTLDKDAPIHRAAHHTATIAIPMLGGLYQHYVRT